MTAKAFPLTWPEAYPRTPADKRRLAPYKVTYEKALRELTLEVRRLGGTYLVISANVPLRDDGMPYADAARRRIPDPGVAIYFQRKGGPVVMACDAWDQPHHNIRALGLTIEGMRAIQRSGAGHLLERAFTGFKALPPASGVPAPPPAKPWWEVLGCPKDMTEVDIVRAYYKTAAKKNHPDIIGESGHDATIEINRAWEEAQEQLKTAGT